MGVSGVSGSSAIPPDQSSTQAQTSLQSLLQNYFTYPTDQNFNTLQSALENVINTTKSPQARNQASEFLDQLLQYQQLLPDVYLYTQENDDQYYPQYEQSQTLKSSMTELATLLAGGHPIN